MLYARKSGHMSTRFEKLVKLSGTNLTQSVYPMITYVQVMQFCFQQLFTEPKHSLLFRQLYFSSKSAIDFEAALHFITYCPTLLHVGIAAFIVYKECFACSSVITIWKILLFIVFLCLFWYFSLMLVAVIMDFSSLYISGKPGWKVAGGYWQGEEEKRQDKVFTAFFWKGWHCRHLLIMDNFVTFSCLTNFF